MKNGDRVVMKVLIAPEDLPIGSLGTVARIDDDYDHSVIVDWDAGWRGAHLPKEIGHESIS